MKRKRGEYILDPRRKKEVPSVLRLGTTSVQIASISDQHPWCRKMWFSDRTDNTELIQIITALKFGKELAII